MTDPAMIAASWASAGATTLAVASALWIAHRDWKRADKDQARRQEAQARLVMFSVTGFGALRVEITNQGSQPILDVALVDIRRAEASEGETWQVNRRVPGSSAEHEILMSGETYKVPVEILDSAGQNLGMASTGYSITLRFTDAQGTGWEQGPNGLLRQDKRPQPFPGRFRLGGAR